MMTNLQNVDKGVDTPEPCVIVDSGYRYVGLLYDTRVQGGNRSWGARLNGKIWGRAFETDPEAQA
jgi:hypothetical protein